MEISKVLAVENKKDSLQPAEVDGTINSVAAEPKVKGKDIRKRCLGCDYFHHLESAELACLRKAVETMRLKMETFRGAGLCKTACCQNKAMYCGGCSR